MSTIDDAARGVVSGYETVASGESEALKGYWNIGTEVRFVVDNKLSFDSFIAAIKAKDTKGYASRRGGHSKPNLSKAGKLVKTFDSYNAMIASLNEAKVGHSFELAYDHAVKVSGSGNGGNTSTTFDATKVAKAIVAKRHLTKAQRRALANALLAL